MHATIASQPTQARQMDYCLADFFLTNLALEGTLMWGNVRDAQDLLIADLGLTRTAPRAPLPLGGKQSFGVQLSGLIECESCGCKYGHITWHARTPNRVDVWECATNHLKRGTCAAPHITPKTKTTTTSASPSSKPASAKPLPPTKQPRRRLNGAQASKPHSTTTGAPSPH